MTGRRISKRQLRLFLRLIQWLPVLRFGRPFTSLHQAARTRVLAYLQNHPVQKVRVGFWGLRTLVLAGYYARPEAARSIGYAASPLGWEAAAMNRLTYDIVIVGSGAGGGTVAQELSPLCHQGVRIAVLEKGPRLRDHEFTGRELEMAATLYEDGGGFLTAEGTMTLAFGSTYGGSTAVYTGTSMLPPERIIRHWNVPGLAHDDLVGRARKFMAENNVHLIEDGLLNQNNRLFVEGCRKLGYDVQQFPVNIKGCRGSSLCNLGCPNQAKQGTDRVQLPRAEQNGVEVVTRCEVLSIGEKKLTARVTAKPHRGKGDPSTWEPGDYQIEAKVIVLCAGAVNTPALLLRSGMGQRLPRLGQVSPRIPLSSWLPNMRHPSPTSSATRKASTWTSSPRATVFCWKPACTFPLSRPRAWRASASPTAPSCAPFPGCR